MVSRVSLVFTFGPKPQFQFGPSSTKNGQYKKKFQSSRNYGPKDERRKIFWVNKNFRF